MFVQAALTASLFLAPQPDVLLVTEARGYVHESIPAARSAIRALEPEIDVREVSGAGLTAAALAGADAVVFANSNGELPIDRRALRRFVRRGGGLAGFHSATGMFDDWPGWESLIGGRFDHHGTPGATERVRVRRHPATRGAPRRFSLAEEFYVHQPGVGRRSTVLARWGAARRPLVWVRTPGRGRVFYDALGHFPRTWADPRQRALVRSGLRWVLRLD